jgi:DNA-binding NtrC family response regulator
MTPQPSPSTSRLPRQRTILLVEDEPFVRDATGSILERAGFTVLSSADAQQATHLYQTCPQGGDLLMTDVVLPGKTGQQLGQDLRQHSSELAVLLTSGYSGPEYEVESPELRTYFLPKPYSRQSLLEKILQSPPLRRTAAQAG